MFWYILPFKTLKQEKILKSNDFLLFYIFPIVLMDLARSKVFWQLPGGWHGWVLLVYILLFIINNQNNLSTIWSRNPYIFPYYYSRIYRHHSILGARGSDDVMLGLLFWKSQKLDFAIQFPIQKYAGIPNFIVLVHFVEKQLTFKFLLFYNDI